MRKTLAVLYCFLFLAASAFAAKPAVLFSACTFDNPSGKPYIELYMNTAGKSVTAVKKQEGKYQGTIQVQLLVKQDKTVVYADKYNLNSPLVSGPMLDSDLVDLQRIVLANGTYILEVKISDLNAAAPEAFIVQQEIIINFPSDHLSISGIELLTSYGPPGKENRFVRNGMSMVPYPDNYYPPGATSIQFYAEVYHADLAFGNDSNFIMRYRIEGGESGKPVANLGGIGKAKAKEVNPLLAEVPFDKLQSGNYSLVVEAVNKNNVVLASRKAHFQLSRKVIIAKASETDDFSAVTTEGTFVERITVADSLREYLRCLYPIADLKERSVSADLVKSGDLKSMQHFFLVFWLSRNSPDPEGAWMEYKAMVNLVNANYQTWNRKGYDTDRGRVYLEYGVPDHIETNYYEMGTHPNEVWQYYVLKDQRNRIFVFVCDNFSTNNFELVHSDANGEITDFRWEDKLRTTQPTNGGNNTWDLTK